MGFFLCFWGFFEQPLRRNPNQISSLDIRVPMGHVLHLEGSQFTYVQGRSSLKGMKGESLQIKSAIRQETTTPEASARSLL